VDATNCPAAEDASPGRRWSALKSLHVSGSPIENSKDVAIFLHFICPTAEVTNHTTNRESQKMWDDVSDYMQLLQMYDQKVGREVDFDSV
jgi:hypothetical protein